MVNRLMQKIILRNFPKIAENIILPPCRFMMRKGKKRSSSIKKCGKVKDFIIVTNNVFEDGIVYDETTMNYIKTLGCINQELAKMADIIIEVVVGIPIIVKEGK